MAFENNSQRKRFKFLHPNKHIDVRTSTDVRTVSSNDDEEISLELNFENVNSSLQLAENTALASSDLALNGALENEHLTSSSNGSNGSNGSSFSKRGSSSSIDNMSLISFKKKAKSSTPVFTENFEFEIPKIITTMHDDNDDNDDNDLQSLNEENECEDVLSMITSTNISQIVDVDQIWVGTNISQILDQAGVGKDDEDDGSKLRSSYDFIMSKNLEQQRLGSSKDVESNVLSECASESQHYPEEDHDKLSFTMKERKTQNKNSKLSEEEQQQESQEKDESKSKEYKIMDVRSVSNASKGFSQLTFISWIKFHRDESSKPVTISEKQYSKQDPELNISGQKLQTLGFFAGVKSFFNRKTDPYDRAYFTLLRKLTTIFENQKLYIHMDARGTKPVGGYPFRAWRMSEHRGDNDSRYSKILHGDGWFGTNVPSSTDFKIITSRSNYVWSKELFLPTIVFPKLAHVADSKDVDTLLNYFSPMFSVFKDDAFPLKCLKYKYWKPETMKDVLEASSFKERKKMSKLLWIEIRSYVNEYQRHMHFRASQVKQIEVSIAHDVLTIMDSIVSGYIEAFNHYDCYSSLENHGSNHAYVKAYEFFQKCPVADYGFYLLQAVTPNILDRNLYKLKEQGFTSLEIIEYIVDNNLYKFDPVTIGFLRIVLAFIQSSYIKKFILRRLLFWVDNTRSVNVGQYVAKFNWFKDTQNFHDQITVSIRDEALEFIKSHKEDVQNK